MCVFGFRFMLYIHTHDEGIIPGFDVYINLVLLSSICISSQVESSTDIFLCSYNSLDQCHYRMVEEATDSHNGESMKCHLSGQQFSSFTVGTISHTR